MRVFVGRNWQIIDDADAQTLIGVTFGIGLLDETIEATGSLAIALAALRAELARPVELGTGGASLPEAMAELGTDTATLTVRGSREAVAAAWRRLPMLFSTDIITDEVRPVRPEQPVWPADLVQRTGRNAASLAWLQGTAVDAHERARVLLAQLNPAVGRTRAVFFTTDESLVGLVFPVKHRDDGPPPGTRWADGTARREANHRPAPQFNVPHGETAAPSAEYAGATPSADSPVLLSTMVPRSAAGVAAAQLLRAQLAATAANTVDTHVALRGTMLGVGAEFCLFLLAEPVMEEAARQRLLAAFSRTLTLVPDPWLEDVTANFRGYQSSRLARERTLFGLGDDPGVNSAELRRLIAGAGDSLHPAPAAYTTGLNYAVQPEPDPPGDDSQSTTGLPGTFPGQEFGDGREFTTWASRGFGDTSTTLVNRLVIGEKGIRSGIRQSRHRSAPTHWQEVDSALALAVFEDQAGSLTIVDDRMRTVSFHPELFRRRHKLQHVLDQQLAGVPRLQYATKVDRAHVLRWARRGKINSAWIASVPTAFAAFIIVMIVLQNTEVPEVTDRLTISETSELANGSEITATGFDIVPANPDDPEYEVTVQVTFCAGGDTDLEGFPPESQRSISPNNFRMFNEDYAEARLVESDGQLRADTLQRGQCATGDLVFKGQYLANPRLSYDNTVGDDVVWYRYGQAPEE